jgi:hypothetical protein
MCMGAGVLNSSDVCGYCATDSVRTNSTTNSTKRPTKAPTKAPTKGSMKASIKGSMNASIKAPTTKPIKVISPTRRPTRLPTEVVTVEPTTVPVKVCNPPITQLERLRQLFLVVFAISSTEDLQNPESSQFAAFNWLGNTDTVCPEDPLDVEQRYIAAVLYFSTNGDNWVLCSATEDSRCPGSPYLDVDANVCDWYDNSCDAAGNVIAIRLGRSLM